MWGVGAGRGRREGAEGREGGGGRDFRHFLQRVAGCVSWRSGVRGSGATFEGSRGRVPDVANVNGTPTGGVAAASWTACHRSVDGSRWQLQPALRARRQRRRLAGDLI